MYDYFLIGNIGSGKTTFLPYLERRFKDALIYREPVDINAVVNRLLEAFYSKLSRSTLVAKLRFQLYLRISMLSFLLTPPLTDRIIENSIPSIVDVFENRMAILTLYGGSRLSRCLIRSLEISRERTEINPKCMVNTPIFIFINTPFRLCSERIRRRNRRGEDTIGIKYLMVLEILYLRTVASLRVNGVRVIELDGRSSPEELSRLLSSELG